MKAASLSELRTELNHLPPEVVMDLCIRLIKYKKENKELLSYLLFDAEDEKAYLEGVCLEIDSLFKDINRRNISQTKKSLQKILRVIAKYAKYSGQKRTEIDLYIYFCQKLRALPIPRSKNSVIEKIYARQFFKIRKLLESLHPDLQYDYEEVMVKLAM
ncbi:MAG: hypothetical protein PHV20_11910 [Bacteroidales bacterium]|nr:hypothetical protein [Bacteroidales bacterium]